MSDKKASTVVIANIVFIIGVIFSSGISYSNISQNKEEIKENKATITSNNKDTQAHILYIRENMLTKEDVNEIRDFILKNGR